MQTITANWQDIVAGIGGVIILARVIVKLTPSTSDDGLLDKFVTFLKHVGLHIPEKK